MKYIILLLRNVKIADIKPQWYLAMFVLSAFLGLLDLVTILAISDPSFGGSLRGGEQSEYVIFLPALVYCLRNLLYVGFALYTAFLATKIRSQLSKKIVESYFQRSYEDLVASEAGLLNRNILAEPNLASSHIINFFVLVAEIVVILVWLITLPLEGVPLIVWVIGIFGLLVYGISFYSFLVEVRRKRALYEKKRGESLIEIVENREYLWVENSRSIFIEKFSSENYRANFNDNIRSWLSGMQRPMIEIIAILIFGLYFVIAQEKSPAIDTTLLALGGLAFVRLLPSSMRCFSLIQSMFISSDALFRVANVYDQGRAYGYKHSSDKSVTKDSVGISVVLPDRDLVIESEVPFNLVAPNKWFIQTDDRDRRFLLRGTTGIGKSSLMKSLVSGESVNGFSFHLTNLSESRLNLGYISQEGKIFAGSVRFNILLDRPYDEVWFEKICENLLLSEWIASLKQGPETKIQRTHNISGGQEQRIAIARAIYGRPSIIVLDEPTSALDQNVANKVINFISSLNWRPWIFVVSHDREDLFEEFNKINLKRINYA